MNAVVGETYGFTDDEIECHKAIMETWFKFKSLSHSDCRVVRDFHDCLGDMKRMLAKRVLHRDSNLMQDHRLDQFQELSCPNCDHRNVLILRLLRDVHPVPDLVRCVECDLLFRVVRVRRCDCCPSDFRFDSEAYT